jgi:peptide/nickel transport system ATP-binding protein
VRHISNRVAVMYLGMLCELADTQILFDEPHHPYTRALLSAIPRLGRKGFAHMRLEGEVPTPIDLPSGCVFHTRCPHAVNVCSEEIPCPILLANGTTVACHRVADGSL